MLFEYTLAVDDIDVTSGGVGGGNVITISGFGFRNGILQWVTTQSSSSSQLSGEALVVSQEYHVLA